MTTFERLQAILVRDYKLAPERLALAAPLEDLGIDSLGVAELLFNVEDEFGITLPPEPVVLPTLGAVVDYIDGLVALQGSAAPATGGGAGKATRSATDAGADAESGAGSAVGTGSSAGAEVVPPAR